MFTFNKNPLEQVFYKPLTPPPLSPKQCPALTLLSTPYPPGQLAVLVLLPLLECHLGTLQLVTFWPAPHHSDALAID